MEGEINMTRRQIDTAREIRLWIGQILVPAAAVVIMVPEVREVVKTKAIEIKRSIDQKLSKKGRG